MPPNRRAARITWEQSYPPLEPEKSVADTIRHLRIHGYANSVKSDAVEHFIIQL